MDLGLLGVSCSTMVVFFGSVCFLGFSCFLPHIDIYTCNGAVTSPKLYKLALWG